MGRVDKALKRFWEKVEKSRTCWEWTASQFRGGYGKFWFRGKNHYAHRFIWAVTHGPISNGRCVLHHCDNPKCVNPAHLFLGSYADNTQDMMLKGRGRWGEGESAGQAVLSNAAVVDIRQRYARGKVTQQALADKYGVQQPAISRVIHRKRWASE